MPSPFPGMDPFIERRHWQDFHDSLALTIREMLVPSLRPRYAAWVEERVYLEMGKPEPYIRPDMVVAEASIRYQTGGGTALLEPIDVTLPMPEEIKEVYLRIEDRETHEVITIIEILSPSNKRAGSTGRDEYLKKRGKVLARPVNLVEIDLLRGGERLPVNEDLPPADYFAIVSRHWNRPHADLYAWNLRSPLPLVKIPLAHGDPDIGLNLQAAFTMVYDRSGYDYTLNYSAPVEPPVSEEDAAWIRDVLASKAQAASAESGAAV